MSCAEMRVTTPVLTVLRATARGVTGILLAIQCSMVTVESDGRRDKHAPPPLLKKTRFGEGPKQYPAYLPVETRHLRGVSGGERHTGCIDEQMMEACERLFETPRPDRLLHVWSSSQRSGDIGLPRTKAVVVPEPSRVYAEITSAHHPPRRAGALMKADA